MTAGRSCGVQAREHAEAVEARHLHVEQDQVGLLLGDRLDRLEAVAALADDLDVRLVLQPVAHPLAGQRLVVHDQSPDLHPCLPRFFCNVADA